MRDANEMPPKRESDRGRKGQSGEVDLSSLKDLKIGPVWGEQRRPGKPAKGIRRGKKDTSHSGQKDSRSRISSNRGHRKAGRSGDHRAVLRRSRKSKPTRVASPAQPTVEVRFFPEEGPFRALTRALRSSYKTYELFEIARLILAKKERFSIMVRRKPDSVEAEKPFYLSVFDGLPFESEEEVIKDGFQAHSEHLLTVRKVSVEPPSGRFQVVNRCTITGIVLGPPNYHRYQTLEREHHRRCLGNHSYASFRSKIEAVKDPKVIDEWVKEMTQGLRYSLDRKIVPADNARIFDDFESARHYLVSHFRERIYKVGESARFSGAIFDRLSMANPIRQSIERELEMQRRFPWDTANSLRGRFKHMNFDVYKKGAKGITYVCVAKRQQRSSSQPLSEPLEEILKAVESHPGIHPTELYSQLCEEQIPLESTTGDGEDQAAVERCRHFTPNLRWLVSEGYITEFTDGVLCSSTASSRLPVSAEPRESFEGGGEVERGE